VIYKEHEIHLIEKIYPGIRLPKLL